jgi:hypothetical protein
MTVLYMQTCVRICSHPERNSLNMYQSEICFEQKLERSLKHIFYIQYNFSVMLRFFEVVKKEGSKRGRIVMLWPHFVTMRVGA